MWEGTAHYRAAYNNPDFRSKLPCYPNGAVATPQVFKKAAIENVCVE